MFRRTAGRWFAIIGGSIVLAIAWIWPMRGPACDLFAGHMLQHLLVMNVAALLFAAGLPQFLVRNHRPSTHQRTALATVTLLQLAALWIWHMPAVFAAMHHNPLLQGLMQVSLFGVALAFWRAVLQRWDQPVWHPVFALLATAKIFCLLGAAFVFSRRTLYPEFGNPETWGLSALEDQQLAGLLMVSSCALIYVAAAIALFARWLVTVEGLRGDRSRWTHGPEIASIAS